MKRDLLIYVADEPRQLCITFLSKTWYLSDMHYNKHFCWFRADFTLDLLSQGHWSFKLFPFCGRKGCLPKCIQSFRNHSGEPRSILCLSTVNSMLINFYLIFWSCHIQVRIIFFFQGVKVIYRTKELEEQQAKRFVYFLFEIWITFPFPFNDWFINFYPFYFQLQIPSLIFSQA